MSSLPDLELRELPPLPDPLQNRMLTDVELFELERTNDIPRSLEGCLTCHGRQQFRWYADKNRSTVADFACPCADQYLALIHYLHAGIMLKYQRLASQDFFLKSDPARDRPVNDYLRNIEPYKDKGLGLVLVGPTNSGKSLMGALLLRHLLGKGYSGRMVEAPRLITAYLSTWNRDGGGAAQEKLDRDYRNVDFLVVDGLGREWQGKSHDNNDRTAPETALENVFRYRAQASLPTIITTNTTTLPAAYGLEDCSIPVKFTRPPAPPVQDPDEVLVTPTVARAQEESRLGITRPIFYG